MLRAQEQDRAENLWLRQAWWELVGEIDPAWLVFLDESGVTTEMTRRYGWGPRSERVREAVPAGHWRTLTVLAALTTEGVLASMSVESPTDGDVFLAFVEQVLAPHLQPGHLVILDNLAAHKVDGVRQLIEARGASVLYLPPYSPDFNHHRTGLVQAQATAARSQSPAPRSTRTSLGAGHCRHHTHRCQCLLSALRLPDTATMKML